MLLECLVAAIAVLAGGLVGYFLFGNLVYGLAVTNVTLVVLGLVIYGIARRRHFLLFQKWANNRHVTIRKFAATSGLVDPGEMPWWRSWSLYDAWGDAPDATNRHYHIFITSVFTLFDIALEVSTDADCKIYKYSDIEGLDIDTMNPDDVIRIIEERRLKRESGERH